MTNFAGVTAVKLYMPLEKSTQTWTIKTVGMQKMSPNDDRNLRNNKQA
jgi:hypothetical protein